MSRVKKDSTNTIETIRGNILLRFMLVLLVVRPRMHRNRNYSRFPETDRRKDLPATPFDGMNKLRSPPHGDDFYTRRRFLSSIESIILIISRQLRFASFVVPRRRQIEVEGNHRVDGGDVAMRRMISQPRSPTAVATSNDLYGESGRCVRFQLQVSMFPEMVGGTIFHREMIQREISRALVLNLFGKANGASARHRIGGCAGMCGGWLTDASLDHRLPQRLPHSCVEESQCGGGADVGRGPCCFTQPMRFSIAEERPRIRAAIPFRFAGSLAPAPPPGSGGGRSQFPVATPCLSVH